MADLAFAPESSGDSLRAVKSRLTLIMVSCMAAAFLVLVRAGWVQLAKNPRLDALARRQFFSRTLIRPQRGTLYDRNGEPLAINIETQSLAANPNKIKNKKALARLISKATHISYQKILQKLESNKEFVWIKRHLAEREMKSFKKWRLIDTEGDLAAGLWWVKESERVYPHRQLASHVIGSVNLDSEGLEGIELWMNERLRGKVVSVSAIKDALGRPTFIDTAAAKNLHDGESISLTLDASLQFEVEQELSHALKRTGSKAGTVIVMESTTGEILAMANEPTFDPHEKGVSADRRRNRSLTDGYEPGSTFKTILLASALSHHWKLSDEIWAERGSITIQGHKISEAQEKEKFEWVSLKKLIQVSSNVASAKLAIKLGADSFLKTIQSFGFGSKTGMGFPGEISGRVPPRKDWMPLTLANIGFGHGVLVTPLQMIRAFAAIQNGGWLVQPKLIKSELATKKDTLGPQAFRILSPGVARDLVSALESVTDVGGTGTKATLEGYRIAGKTGTAQMVDPSTGKYSHDRHIASFIGFPVDVDPKIVIFVSLVEPQGAYYAAQTAVPLFKEVLSSVVNRCSLPVQMNALKVLSENESQLRREGAGASNPNGRDSVNQDQIKLSRASPLLVTGHNSVSGTGLGTLHRDEFSLQPVVDPEKGQSSWIMPSLIGLTPRETLQILKGHYFGMEMIGNGVVSSQNPSAGKKIVEGDNLRLYLSEP